MSCSGRAGFRPPPAASRWLFSHHARRSPGGASGPRVGGPALLADAVGGVAAVGHQARPAAPSRRGRWPTRPPLVTASSGAVTVRGPRVVAAWWKSSKMRRPGHRGRLVDLAVQHPGPGGQPANGYGSADRPPRTAARRQSAWGPRRAGAPCGPRRSDGARSDRSLPAAQYPDRPVRSAVRSASGNGGAARTGRPSPASAGRSGSSPGCLHRIW